MKKIFTVLLFCFFSSWAYSQDVTLKLEELTKLKNEQKQLADSVQSLIKQLKKNEGELATAQTNLGKAEEKARQAEQQVEGEKALRGNIEALKRDTTRLGQELKKAKEQYAKLEQKTKGAKDWEKEKAGLDAELNKVRKEKVTADTLVSQKEREIKRLRLEVGAMESIKQARNECLAKEAKWNSEITEKDRHLASFQATISTLQTEKKQAEDRIAPLQTDKQNLTNALLNSLRFSVEYLITSADYQTVKAEELIRACEGYQQEHQEAKTWVEKLTRYKVLCGAIQEARQVLVVHYQKETTSKALQNLTTATTFVEIHKKDIAQHKWLLENYCKIHTKTLKKISDAQIFMPDEPNKTKSLLSEFLAQKEIVGYPYLVGVLERVVQNPGMDSPLKKTDCN